LAWVSITAAGQQVGERREAVAVAAGDDDLRRVAARRHGLLDRLQQPRLGDRQLGLRDAQDVHELAGGVRHVRGHEHRAEAGGREPRDQDLGAVAQVDDDAVAPADVALGEAARAAADLGGELVVGQLRDSLVAVLEDEERAVAVRLGALLEDVGQGAVAERVEHHAMYMPPLTSSVTPWT